MEQPHTGCWWPICTASDVRTLPLVYTVMWLKKWQNIRCYTTQHTTGLVGVMAQPPLSETPVELPGEDEVVTSPPDWEYKRESGSYSTRH